MVNSQAINAKQTGFTSINQEFRQEFVGMVGIDTMIYNNGDAGLEIQVKHMTKNDNDTGWGTTIFSGTLLELIALIELANAVKNAIPTAGAAAPVC